MDANVGCIKALSRSLTLLHSNVTEDQMQMQKCQLVVGSLHSYASAMSKFLNENEMTKCAKQ